jgi:hypothetical protein
MLRIVARSRRREAARAVRATLALAACAVVAAAPVGSQNSSAAGSASARRSTQTTTAFALSDVARQSGLDFRQGAFRFEVSRDPVAMMGSGVCWLDYDRDGWMDLFVVNSYSERDTGRWQKQGGLPRSALFHNVKGRFVDVSARSGANLAVRGTGCVAADLDQDGHTDLYVATAGTSALLWNRGDGTFAEGARAAGVTAYGWHSSAAVGDVNGDGRPDLYVAGYTDVNAETPGSDAGFPTNYQGVRDLLYLNTGRGKGGHARFREVGRGAGLETARFDHSLGAVLSDLDGDGRLDLYVANDEDPNRLYENVAWPGGAKADPAALGFRFEERAGPASAADPNAGMGVADGDINGDGIPDLFVSNSRGQPHAVLAGRPPGQAGALFADGRPGFVTAFGRSFTGWGVSLPDLDLDGDRDLVLANGAIPVTNLARDAQPIQVLENHTMQGAPGEFADSSTAAGVSRLPKIVGRGLAAADFDNDGRVDFAVNTVGGRLLLLKSTTAGGHWLEVALPGSRPGARVTAVLPDGRRLVREVHAGSSYLSSEDPRPHFGLGSATAVSELIVRFPNGSTTRLRDVAADRLVTVHPEPWRTEGCVRAQAGHSVARVWNEAILDAIRRDIPAPTTHARNLFHLSAAMWDAWAAYDPKADGYFVTEKHTAPDALAARETAISYAAYRVLLWRYAQGAGLQATFDQLTATMGSLCLRPDFTSTSGDSPAALGNRIAAAVIEAGRDDGSLEAQHYADPSYVPVNEPLVVKRPGTAMHDATLWQPLALDQVITQNNVELPGKVQVFIGAQWGHVRSFALPPSKQGVPIDPGPPPIGLPESQAYKQAAVDVIRLSSELDPGDGQTTEIGLDARGDNPLGTNDGNGYDVNPVTGKPYAGNRVLLGDFGRVLAEFWADGPSSETPPGHWNTIANAVSDSPQLAPRIGPGAANRLSWDVHLYFALDGAVHDAAIAAWGLKRQYQSVRPISMIRYLAGNGQSSDPAGPSYDKKGLPLVPGLIEVVTAASSAPGQRHAALAGHVGEIAVRSWQGAPKDATTKIGVGWVLSENWMPYQRPTFVTPAFPGFVSGHSTFSRAAAEVLSAYTGSPFFPGGMFEQVFPPGYLRFEQGPSAPLTLQWATYYDAADQAGSSRLYGGIHVAVDDFAGRRIGSRVGKGAWALAQRYFDGTARP